MNRYLVYYRLLDRAFPDSLVLWADTRQLAEQEVIEFAKGKPIEILDSMEIDKHSNFHSALSLSNYIREMH